MDKGLEETFLQKTYMNGQSAHEKILNIFSYSRMVILKRQKITNKNVRRVKQLYVVDQFSSVTQLCPTLCDPMDCSTPGLPVHHQLLQFTQTHVHWVGDTIQPSHPLSSPSLSTFNLFQHQGLFKWISSLDQVARVLEFQLQHQSFQRTLRTYLL